MNRPMILFALALWITMGAIALISTYAHADEPPIRLSVTLTCDDIRALAGWQGWPEIERRAREAGASEGAIEKAKSCLR